MVLILWIGIWPNWILSVINKAVAMVVQPDVMLALDASITMR